jgi:hypothetical protein
MAGGGGTNTVTRTELDPTMRPFVEYGLQESKNLYQQGNLPSFYPGQTYVGPSQTTQSAMQMAQERAAAGSPLVRGAQQTAGALQTAMNPALGGFADVYSRGMANPAMQYAQQTAGGAYLGGNPFFQGAFNPAARQAEQQYSDAMQRINSQASQAGRYGSNAMGQLQDRSTGAFAQALTDTAGRLAFENYGQERGRQEAAVGQLGAMSNQGIQNQLAAMGGMASTAGQDYARQLQAAGMAPALAGQDYADIQRLMDLGQTQESYQEMALADSMNRFNFEQMQPYNRLQSYLSSAYGAPQGMQTTQPIFRNQFGSAIGGGLTGYALGGPLGGLGGAALGGLLG